MEGRPPQILENIEWLRVNFLKYSLHIALAVSVFVGGHYYTKYESLKAESTLEIETLNERLVDYQGCRTVSPHGDQPLQVTFTDGRVAYANSFSVILPRLFFLLLIQTTINRNIEILISEGMNQHYSH